MPPAYILSHKSRCVNLSFRVIFVAGLKQGTRVDKVSKLLEAIRQDCPVRAIRPVESLRGAAERGAEEMVAAAALACSDDGTCPDFVACSAVAAAVLDRLWRESAAVPAGLGGGLGPAPPRPEGRGASPRRPCPGVGAL